MTEDEATAQIQELQQRLADASEAMTFLIAEADAAEGWLKSFSPLIRAHLADDPATLAQFEDYVGGEW